MKLVLGESDWSPIICANGLFDLVAILVGGGRQMREDKAVGLALFGNAPEGHRRRVQCVQNGRRLGRIQDCAVDDEKRSVIRDFSQIVEATWINVTTERDAFSGMVDPVDDRRRVAVVASYRPYDQSIPGIDDRWLLPGTQRGR